MDDTDPGTEKQQYPEGDISMRKKKASSETVQKLCASLTIVYFCWYGHFSVGGI